MASSVKTPADWERAIIQIHRKAYHLRPEIAVSFDRSQADALIVALEGTLARLAALRETLQQDS